MHQAREVTLGKNWRPKRLWGLTRPQLMFISALAAGAAIGLSVSANRKF